MEIDVPKEGLTALFDKLSQRIFKENSVSRQPEHELFKVRFNRRISGKLRNIVYCGLLSREKYGLEKALVVGGKHFSVKNRLCVLGYNFKAMGLDNKSKKLDNLLSNLDLTSNTSSAFTGQIDTVHEVEAVLDILLTLSNDAKMMTQDPCEVWRKEDEYSQLITADQTNPAAFYSDKHNIHTSQFNSVYQYYPSELFECLPCFGVPKKGFENDEISLPSNIFSQEPGSCGLTKWFGIQRNNDSFFKNTRTTLYNALIHSKTSDIEVKLSLPDLPLHSDLRLHSKPLEASMISEDEGFAEISEEFEGSTTPDVSDETEVQSLALWDKALKQKPSCFYTWEERKEIGLQSCKPFFTEAGPKVFDCLCDMRSKEASYLVNAPSASFKYLEMEELIRDVLMVFIGVPSQTFQLEKSTCSFLVSRRTRLSGCSLDSLHHSLQGLADIGTNYLRLSKFTSCQRHSTMIQSSVLRAYIAGLRKYLQKYREIIIMVEASHVQSAFDLSTKFIKQANELKFLSDVCLCSQAFAGELGKPKPKFPVGVKLLSYLYQLCLINLNSPVAYLVLFLLKVSCAPYLRFVQQWVFKGRCTDIYKEFMINRNDIYIAYRDKHYWTNGYTMASKTKMEGVPMFLKDLADDMFTCGKSINLLKLCFPAHYVCNHEAGVPVMNVVYSLNSLKVICQSSRRYGDRMKKLGEQKKLEWERKKNEEKSKRHQVLILEREKANKALAVVKELVKKAKVALAEKKKEELDFLKQQMEDALNKKILDVKKADEVDAKVMRNSLFYEVTTGRLDEQLKEEAREELIRYYEMLTREAERREAHALWLTRRHALKNERKKYLEKEADSLEKMRKEMSDRMVDEDKETAVGLRKQWVINTEASNTIIQNIDGADGALSNHASQSTVQNLIYNTSGTREATGKEGEVSTKRATESTIQSLIYPSTGPALTSGKMQARAEGRKTMDSSRGVMEQLSTVEHLMYPSGDTSGKTTNLRRGGNEQSSTIEHLMYPSGDISGKTGKSSRGVTEQSSTIEHLMYPSGDTSGKTTNLRRGVTEQSSTIEHLMYPSGDISGKTGKSSRGVTEQSSTIEHLMYPSGDTSGKTGKSSRGVTEQSSTIEHLMYPSGDTTSKTTTSNRRITGQSSTIEHLMYPSDNASSKTTMSSRGITGQSSTIEHLMYPSDNASSKTTMSNRGITGQSSTIEHLMYPSDDANIKTTKSKTAVKSSRGSEASSTVKGLLYPSGDANSEKAKSSRGSEPPSTIQKLMYPAPRTIQESEEKQRKSLTHEDVWVATQFESYRENFDILDEEPFGDIFARIVPHRQGLRDDFYACETENEDLESENNACKVLCLPVILQRCVVEPLITQINIVNSAIVTYFMDDLKLIEHFETLKKFVLMEDGEFSFSLTQQLSEKVSSGVTPQQLCCISTLNSIMALAIQSSVYACQSENTRSLSFVLQTLPDIFKRNDVGVFDFIQLRYKIPWPVNIVITENCITKYNRIFAFMLRLKWIVWILQDIRYSLKRMDKCANNSPQLRKIHLFRHEMSHFVNDVQGYISNQILHVTWQEFLQSLHQNVRNLDDLHDCHADYLNKALFRALLNKKAAPVMKIISDLFTMVLKFRTQLVSSSWTVDPSSGHLVHPGFSLLCSTHESFRESTCFLLTVISKLVTRGYQPHLEELLLRLDFNSYYGKQ